MYLGDSVVRAPPGPEPVGDRFEVGLEDRFQDQFQCRLHDPVSDGRDAQPPNLPGPTGFGNRALPHRQGTERALAQLGPQVVQEPRHTDDPLDVGDGEAVHASGAGAEVARDPIERNEQRRRVVHEVEQVVEPAARIGRRPTVKLGLHPRYPLA
jgi:hypothetical protein